MLRFRALTGSIVLPGLLATVAAAQTPTFPLPGTTGDTTSTEDTAPFLVPKGVKQTKVTSRKDLTGLPSTFGNWDMVAYDPTGRYIFVPAEVGQGAGVFRYDTVTKTYLTLLLGNNTGMRESDPTKWSATNDDFARLDPATWTPWRTVVIGEETTGGRLFEIMDPMSTTTPQVVWRSNIPAVAHEGIRFDKNGTIYVVDEDNSGCVYKFVPSKKGDLSVGQTFVLSVDAYAADSSVDASATWSASANRYATRVGPATWIPMTDANGKALTTVDPFAYVTTTGGRNAADELKGTPYGRPEDCDFNVLASGNQCLYFTATSENTIYSVELLGDTKAMVRVFVDFDSVNRYTGRDVNPKQNDPWTNAGPSTETNLKSPDNLAVDHFGSIYIIEDQNPGDIWKCFDNNKDGVAESIGLFVSLGAAGCEPTGLIAHPTDPYKFLVAIQHPSSGNDALWTFDTNPYMGSTSDLTLATGVNMAPSYGPAEFVRSAMVNDILAYSLTSPTGSLVGKTYAVLAQAVDTKTGLKSLLGSIWIDPNAPIVLLAGGTLAQEGTRLWLEVPAGLSGVSIVAQALAVDSSALVFSPATETVLR
ncbi:MAG: DUF839 domain-containing protein [Planctomycetes bacterium]|nr:DUF839 domain-containing protein [Planctomycetota bacterium]MCB9892086.1 DUF839 domain-containing protein [Planctomycetota bacterium]MCB9920342.1 DUF839 domain-containing protein [Planctomycetota bacterium]